MADCRRIETDPVLKDLTQQMDDCGLALVQRDILALLQARARARARRNKSYVLVPFLISSAYLHVHPVGVWRIVRADEQTKSS